MPNTAPAQHKSAPQAPRPDSPRPQAPSHDSPRSQAPRPTLFQWLRAFTFLSLLCALFYVALDYYASTALKSINEAQNLYSAGNALGSSGVKRVIVLRMGFTLAFCWLLGMVGFRVTRTLWAGALVHFAAVLLMLGLSMPLPQLLHNAALALLLSGIVGGVTLVFAAMTRWREKMPRRKR